MEIFQTKVTTRVKKKTLITSRAAAGSLLRGATDMDHWLQLNALVLKKIPPYG